MRWANMETANWGTRIAAAAGAVLILALIGLAVYGGTVTPRQHEVEVVFPNDRFAH
jgi:hypothetical protein